MRSCPDTDIDPSALLLLRPPHQESVCFNNSFIEKIFMFPSHEITKTQEKSIMPAFDYL